MNKKNRLVKCRLSIWVGWSLAWALIAALALAAEPGAGAGKSASAQPSKKGRSPAIRVELSELRDQAKGSKRKNPDEEHPVEAVVEVLDSKGGPVVNEQPITLRAEAEVDPSYSLIVAKTNTNKPLCWLITDLTNKVNCCAITDDKGMVHKDKDSVKCNPLGNKVTCKNHIFNGTRCTSKRQVQGKPEFHRIVDVYPINKGIVNEVIVLE